MPASGRLSLSSSINLATFRAVFRVATWFRPVKPAPIRLSGTSRVLCISTAGIGDSLLDSAGIRAVAESFPGIHLEAVIHHRRKDVAAHNPFLKKLHLLRKGPVAFLKLWGELRKHGAWDAVLFFSCHDPEARCLGYLLASQSTVGLTWRTTMPWLCAHNVGDRLLRKAHLAAQAVRIAAEAGAATSIVRMVYQVSEVDREGLNEKLTALGMPRAPGIVFQLGGGGGVYRDWPLEHFVELAHLAHSEGMGPIFLLGGPDHSEKATRFAGKASGLAFHDVVGKLPLAQSAALLERARCLVSTDTGIMHLGFAIGTPTLALLHCSPGPARVGPTYDAQRHAVIALPKPKGYRSPSEVSMSSIRPCEAFEALQMLRSREE